MNADAATVRSCGKCGATLPDDAPPGVCPQCELRGVLDLLPDGAATPVTEGHAGSAGNPAATRRFGNYELLEEIARGGMGVVYRARQVNLNRIVAVKLILAGPFAGKQFVQRFRAEAAAAAILQHPNIVAVHDVGLEDGQHYFSMDLVEGQNLTQVVGQRPLAPARAARYVQVLAEAIHYAHEQGILHRDLKPSNVLIDATDQPRITDFGLAKRLDGESSLTLTGQVLGSPNFMSPEQAGGDRGKVGRSSDVYGLGAILYFLLTARVPFQAGSLEAIVTQVLHTEPISPRLLNPAVPRDLVTICLKCLEKDSARRYVTAQGLAEDLGCFLHDQPIHARPIGRIGRCGRWCRRKPALTGSLAAAVLLLLVVAVGSPIAAFRLHRERQRLAETSEELRRHLFAGDMSLAQQALAVNNLGRARALLNRHRPSPGQTDLRGWEWRYLWQQCRSDALHTLGRKPDEITALAVSSDGHWLAVASEGKGGLSIWDLRTRREVARPAPEEVPQCVAFSPNEPVLAFAVVSATGPRNRPATLGLWDAARGKYLGQAAQADSGLRQVSSEGGPTRIIDGRFLLGGQCRRLAFSPDGRKLIVCTGIPAEEILIWDVRSQRTLAAHPAPGQEIYGSTFAVARDVSLVAYESFKQGLRLLDLTKTNEMWTIQATEDAYLNTLAFSPNGKIIASGAGRTDSAIHLWDAATGQEIRRLDGHRSYVTDLVFWPDGNTLASASADQTIGLWDLRDLANVPTPRILRGHNWEIQSLVLLPDRRTLVSGSKDGELCLWDTEKAPLDRGHVTLRIANQTRGITEWRFASNGPAVLARDREGRVVRWQGGNFQDKQILLDLGREVYWSCFSDDAAMIATVQSNGTVQVWDTQRRVLVSELTGVSHTPYHWKFRSHGKRLLLRSDAGFQEWDLDTHSKIRDWHDPRSVTTVTYSPDDRWQLIVCGNGPSLLRDFTTGFESNLVLNIRPADGSGWSIDGKVFGVVGLETGGIVRLWEVATFREVGTFRGFRHDPHSVTFSPDGQRLAAGSGGKEAVKLFDLATRQELLTLEAEGGFFRVRYSPDGSTLGATSDRGLLHLWRAPSFAEIEAAESNQP